MRGLCCICICIFICTYSGKWGGLCKIRVCTHTLLSRCCRSSWNHMRAKNVRHKSTATISKNKTIKSMPEEYRRPLSVSARNPIFTSPVFMSSKVILTKQKSPVFELYVTKSARHHAVPGLIHMSFCSFSSCSRASSNELVELLNVNFCKVGRNSRLAKLRHLLSWVWELIFACE